MAQIVGGYPDPTGADLTDCHALTITLPGAGAVDLTNNVKAFTTSKELTSDLPDGTRLQTGYPSASATFTLDGPYPGGTGETQDMGWLFGRYSTDSPLYHASAVHAPVTLDAGLSGVLVRQFTGLIDSYTVKPDGTVDVSCIDNRSLLRSVAKLPPVVTLPPYNAGLTSEYAIDALLRAATGGAISTWPAQVPDCVLAVGLHSSLWPEVGVMNVNGGTQPVPTFGPGAFGSAQVLPDEGRTIPAGEFPESDWGLSAPLGDETYVEFWATGIVGTYPRYGVQVFIGGPTDAFVAMIVSSDRIVLTIYNNVSAPVEYTWVTSIDSSSHFIALSLLWPIGGSTFSGSIVLDETVHTIPSTSIPGGTRPVDATLNYVLLSKYNLNVGGRTCVEGFQVGASIPVAPRIDFIPAAVLDPSLNSLQIVPDMTGDPWQILQQIATAELGVCGFDEHGIFRFRNRKTIQAQPLSGTLQSTGALVDLDVQTSSASVANRCQVDATPWEFRATSRIYEHSALTRVPAHGSVTLTPTLDALAVETDGSVSKLPDGWAGTAFSYYRASADRFGNTEHPGLRFVVTQVSSSQLSIIPHNDTPLDAWLVSSANYTDIPVGTPVLYIAGRLVIPSSTETKDVQWPPLIAGLNGAMDTGGAASTDVGEIAVQITGNPWIQDPDAAQLLAQDVMTDQCVARDTFDNVSVVPDHLLQLTDRRRIVDSDATGVDDYVYVFGASLSYDGTSQSQTLTVRTLAPPGGWLVGVAGRSEIGVGIIQGTAYVYA